MKRFLFLLLLAAPVQADIAIKHTQSASLKVDGAAVQAIRVPSTYAVSGNNMKVTTDEHFGKLTAGTATTAATLDVGVYEMNTVGSSFSFEESWLQGDAIPAIGSGVDVSAGVVTDMPAFGNTVVTSGGVASTLAGSVLSSGVISITAGGAGTTATAQTSSEVTVQ
tara:strand:- start:45 stop:542 length:498 start_codon:yes stop_codon:yes gene_type:complete